MKKKERIIGAIVLLAVLGSVLLFVSNMRKPQEFSQKEVLEMFNEEEDSGMESTKKISSKSETVNEEKNQDVKTERKNIVVEIKGEVVKPNVYTLAENSRVNDIIEKAGGLTSEANINNINRASLLSDGECIVIRNINDKDVDMQEENLNNKVNTLSQGSSSASSGDSININTASKDELKTLSGIGDTKAEAIIEYRDSNGGFKSIDELKNVSGIGEGTLNKIREKININ